MIEDNNQFLGVHMGYQLDVRSRSLGLFANYFSLKSLSLVLSKLTELSNTSLLFDLNYKFINESLAFSPA